MKDSGTTSRAELLEASHIFDDASVRDLVASTASRYDMSYCCIAIDMGDRLELRAKLGPLPRVVEAAPYVSLLARITARRRLPKIIFDAKHDDRYTQDPLVAGAPEVRFFVGAPILVDSCTCMGLLCLMSPEPAEHFSLNDCGELLAAAEAIADQYRKLSTQGDRALATTPTMDSLPTVDS